MNEEQIKKWTDQEDLLALCGLTDEAARGTNEDKELLRDAITQILEIWLMDFDTQKGGNPDDYPFLDGVQALETLQMLAATEGLSYRASYLIQCADYFSRTKSAEKAREKANEAETLLLDFQKKNPQEQISYHYLIDLYHDFPSEDLREKELKFIQAINFSNQALPLSPFFLYRQLRLFYAKNEFPSLESRLINERKTWLQHATEAAEQNPAFALEMGKQCVWLIEDMQSQNPIRQEIEQILPLFADSAMKGLAQASFQADPISAGHVFMRLGKFLQKEIYFEAAQNLYAGHSIRVAADRKQATRHTMTYEINAKEERAKILEKTGHPVDAEKFRQQNIDCYLREWRNFPNDISYLSHAMEYVLGRISSLSPKERPQFLLTELRDISLAAEAGGGGHYWFPYTGLFWSYTFLGQNDEAKLWLGRGYFSLTILIEKQLQSLEEMARKMAPPEMAEFIHQLCDHLDRTPDKTFWPGPPPRQQVLQLSLSEIQNRLSS